MVDIKQFKIVRVGPYMDNKNWQASCQISDGSFCAFRGQTAMQALHGLFLELGEEDDEIGADSEIDGTQPLLPSNFGQPPNCT